MTRSSTPPVPTLPSSTAQRLKAYSAAAGLGAFAIGNAAEGAITVVDVPDFIKTRLTGAPYPFQPEGTFRWATENFDYTYSGVYPGAAFGIDLSQNGVGDFNIFRGPNYGGYIVARTDIVGYYGGSINGENTVRLLNNFDNPDADGDPTGGAEPLQGFNAGEVIGDNDTVGLTSGQNTIRNAYSYGDWDGVPDNAGPTPNTNSDPSYIGFEVDLDANGSFDGFGWLEVIVREVAWDPNDTAAFSHPEIEILRFAFTDDGSTIIAGDDGASEGVNGDYNDSGQVEQGDLDLVLQNWGLDTDANGVPTGWTNDLPSGQIEQTELDGVLQNWGNTAAPNFRGSNVPEPGMLMLLAAGAGAAAARRPRRR